jgi:hypothetical protein
VSVDPFDARDELRIIGLLLSCFYSSSVVTQSESKYTSIKDMV